MKTASIAIALLAVPALAGDDPYADQFISYDEGANPAPGFTDPATSLGSPERFTGEGVFPSVVSEFSPPFLTTELVSIGAGGHLVVRFDTPVIDDPCNPFGIDLLIFGNTGFIDDAWPNGIAGGLFGNDGGLVEVSADGVSWTIVPSVAADGMFPTIGYLDAGPYDAMPGSVLSDFTLPVDPALTSGDFVGMNHAAIVAVYAGSGGGAGIDLGLVGLSSVSYVRVTNPGDPATTPNVEIDALSDVAPQAGTEPADLNADCTVGIVDLFLLFASWGACPAPCPADLDRDGVVGIADLFILFGAWT